MTGSLTMMDSMAKVVTDEAFLQKAEYLSDEMMMIISDLETHCSNLSLAEDKGIGAIEKRLDALQEKIVAWDSDQSMIWDRDPEEASEYLNVVDEVRQVVESLGSLHAKVRDDECNELVRRAHSSLQMAMARLEEEFVHLLVQYQQPVEPDHVSFRSTEDDPVDDFSCSSFDEEPIIGKIRSEISLHSEEFVIDLVHPTAVFDLKCIAAMMLMSGYDKECCQAYINVRKEALDECLLFLRIEKWSIEEVLQMDWSLLNSKIKRWNRAMKVFIRVYLNSERRLCDLVLGDHSLSVRDSCFVETTKGAIFQMLNFGEAVSIGSPKPEKLFRVLDMYEGLSHLIPDVESLFSEELGFSILTECQEVLSRLGECIRLILTEFKNAIRSNTSTNAFAGGGIHPLTKYVMNYIKALADYSETLDLLLEDQDDNDLSESSKAILGSLEKSTPVVHYLLSITSIVESNLEGRSMLYRDGALQHIFLMNNIFYMVQKVKDSELQKFLGEEWIKEHSKSYRHHSISYERASWNPVLLFLKDEGICNPGSNSPSKTVLKERFKNFNLIFEEVYKSQTSWVIPNSQLRVELRISISLKVLQAYRTFMGRYSSHLDSVRQKDKYIKYSPDDLEEFLLDLFEGSAKSLHSFRRRIISIHSKDQ
ncbi:Exocyst complex component Exo70 protein [Dioscorea alata]|uniref:Exocyst complex component Exo70 protein n=1 Tax=Dioscorea alata TaxID=55571 RepID=A0ACB7TWC8_DIOAL|nr:Exocyst complex component Exo70 protein [Dioscorea alata]